MTYHDIVDYITGLDPWAQSLIGLGLLLLAAIFGNFIVKSIILRLLQKLFGALLHRLHADHLNLVVKRLSNIVPAAIIGRGILLVPHLSEGVITVVQNLTAAFVILTLALSVTGLLDIGNSLYQRRADAVNKPIKGYIQVLKIGVYFITAILVIAALIEKSPLLLFSGLGAMAAVLMLVFKDTLLSLVASVQIGSGDMLRVGDWVEMPQLNADGDVIDIALHTVKIQNWDKTITTIPTQRFITDTFKNWRGMSESGGRRIKRALFLDQSSIKFLSEDEIANLRRFALIDDYLDSKTKELQDYNSRLIAAGRDPINTRRVTNVGTFRAYVNAYLVSHPSIHKDMTLLVRQLQPTSQGLPLEIYAFTNTTAWGAYEAIQADIFDHLLAIAEKFDLRIFQELSDSSMFLANRATDEHAG